MHVADGKDMNEATDNRDDEQHHRGHAVEIETHRQFDFVDFNPRERDGFRARRNLRQKEEGADCGDKYSRGRDEILARIISTGQ